MHLNFKYQATRGRLRKSGKTTTMQVSFLEEEGPREHLLPCRQHGNNTGIVSTSGAIGVAGRTGVGAGDSTARELTQEPRHLSVDRTGDSRHHQQSFTYVESAATRTRAQHTTSVQSPDRSDVRPDALAASRPPTIYRGPFRLARRPRSMYRDISRPLDVSRCTERRRGTRTASPRVFFSSIPLPRFDKRLLSQESAFSKSR